MLPTKKQRSKDKLKVLGCLARFEISFPESSGIF